MGSATHFVSIALALVAFAAAAFLFKRKAFFVLFLVLGALLVAFPFVNTAVATSGAYEWKIVVQREIAEGSDPTVIFIQDIEWITEYPRIERHRDDVRSLILDEDTVGKEWDAKGYIPLSIRAEILYGSNNIGVTRTFRELAPGSYTFTLTFNENDQGSWTVEKREDRLWRDR